MLEDGEMKLKTTGEAIGIDIIGEHTAPQLLRCQVWGGETGIRLRDGTTPFIEEIVPPSLRNHLYRRSAAVFRREA